VTPPAARRGAPGERAARRRGSVLVLVVTLLSILFVMGVAFLATMNFEADRLASESRRQRTELGAEALIDDAGALLRDGLMSDAEQPFAGNDAGASLTGFAQLPGWHDVSSPIEPFVRFDGRVDWPWFVDARTGDATQGVCILGNPGDPTATADASCSSDAECPSGRCKEVFTCVGGPNSGAICQPDFDCPGGLCDTQSGNGVCKGGAKAQNPQSPPSPCSPNLSCPAGACVRAPFGGPRWRGAELDTTWRPGTIHFLTVCQSGARAGMSCRSDNDCGNGTDRCISIRNLCVDGARDGQTCLVANDCPNGTCTAESVVVVDADGDGMVDAVEVPAGDIGFSPEQVEQISTVVNGSADTSGRVFVGLRIVPHGGMVNLNDAHPLLIENALNINSVFDDPDPRNGRPLIRPAKQQVFYTPQQEEPALRRRGIFPARLMPPTRLQGDPLVSPDLRAGDPFGGADMPLQLFPPTLPRGSFETVFQGEHRFWPVHSDEPLYASDLNSPGYWFARMEPFVSFNFDPTESEYDRRHLVTTVSHDALLARGGRLVVDEQPRDVRDLMMQVNGDFQGNCNVVPFEYPDYPHDIPNNTKPNEQDAVCECPDLKVCSFDPRKGRLQLSLAWMDEALERWRSNPNDLPFNPQQRKRLIYDVFYLLLNNAAGPAWDDVVCTVPGDCDAQTERCSGDLNKPGLCVDRVLNLPRHQARATRTAASLTANLLDYMDNRVCVGGEFDGAGCANDRDCGGGSAFCGPADAPTRVAIRSFDFGGGVCVGKPGATYVGEYCRTNDDCKDPTNNVLSATCSNFSPSTEIRSCSGGDKEGRLCTAHADCQSNGPLGSGACVATVGRKINISATPTTDTRFEYVYGLERQPFITEVATVTDTETGDEKLIGWAVELFNPTDAPIPMAGVYELVEVDANQKVTNRIPLDQTIPPGRFALFVTGGPFEVDVDNPPDGSTVKLDSTVRLGFRDGSTLYLVATSSYAKPAGSMRFVTVPVSVVVDAFVVKGLVIGRDKNNAPPDGWDIRDGTMVASLQRPVLSTSPWSAPIPETVESSGDQSDNGAIDDIAETLGAFNTNSSITTIHPVEIRFANTGSFTQPDPTLPRGDINEKAVAFPTTGSLLLLMRYANHSLDDLQMPSHGNPNAAANPVVLNDRLAFTAWLNDSTVLKDSNGGIIATINAREQIDNGRMPVFDVGTTASGRQYAANHRPAWQSAPRRPGGVANLPWGQLVFDYFTALPLHNRGPFRPDPFDNNAPIGAPGSQPRVDQRGLRVHGRIDLNAAPWTVLRGLPFIPLEQVPNVYRDRFRLLLFGANAGPLTDGVAQQLGEDLAQAIVAYREAREGVPNATPSTGDYGRLGVGRSYLDANPAFRRGTGFLTVGELANVRHLFAAKTNPGQPLVNPAGRASLFRFDNGRVVFNRDDLDRDGNPGPAYDANQDDYILAIGQLASLGDWVTVRSDVFTVYGVVRGEIDPSFAGSVPDLNEAEIRAIDDVDTRALRFQETVDRLPTFLGARTPARVGNRTLAKYKDVQSD